MGKALVARTASREILDEPQEELFENFQQPTIQGSIVFENVSFGYEPGHYVLRMLALRCPWADRGHPGAYRIWQELPGAAPGPPL